MSPCEPTPCITTPDNNHHTKHMRIIVGGCSLACTPKLRNVSFELRNVRFRLRNVSFTYRQARRALAHRLGVAGALRENRGARFFGEGDLVGGGGFDEPPHAVAVVQQGLLEAQPAVSVVLANVLLEGGQHARGVAVVPEDKHQVVAGVADVVVVLAHNPLESPSPSQ
jgi:hypothetical protein